jgi:hypothetical protein
MGPVVVSLSGLSMLAYFFFSPAVKNYLLLIRDAFGKALSALSR